MPERSFGRTVRYRRTKLGLSQAKLAELVGRSTPTIRSWERDKSRPNDPQVLSALAAILGVDERQLFDKAEVDQPEVETSPTVEEALATLSFAASPTDGEEDPAPDPVPLVSAPVSLDQYTIDLVEVDDGADDELESAADRELVAATSGSTPAFVAPPDPYVQTPLTPTLADVSYMEDGAQRQLYRVRNLATLVAFVVLVIAFVWAAGEGLGALGDWWNAFFGELRV